MTAFILFIISLLSLSALILYKSWKLRTKGPSLRTGDTLHVHKHWFSHEELGALRTRAWEKAKKNLHLAILSMIKTWIVIVHIVQKRLREKFPKIFKEPTATDKTKTSSPFLKTVAEYKTKIKRFKKKIKEQDL